MSPQLWLWAPLDASNTFWKTLVTVVGVGSAPCLLWLMSSLSPGGQGGLSTQGGEAYRTSQKKGSSLQVEKPDSVPVLLQQRK